MRHDVHRSQRFLDAPSHLFKRVCPSVRPSIRLSVHPSVHNAFSQITARRILSRVLGLGIFHSVKNGLLTNRIGLHGASCILMNYTLLSLETPTPLSGLGCNRSATLFSFYSLLVKIEGERERKKEKER